jgi:hypothetical protein
MTPDPYSTLQPVRFLPVIDDVKEFGHHVHCVDNSKKHQAEDW